MILHLYVTMRADDVAPGTTIVIDPGMPGAHLAIVDEVRRSLDGLAILYRRLGAEGGRRHVLRVDTFDRVAVELSDASAAKVCAMVEEHLADAAGRSARVAAYAVGPTWVQRPEDRPEYTDDDDSEVQPA